MYTPHHQAEPDKAGAATAGRSPVPPRWPSQRIFTGRPVSPAPPRRPPPAVSPGGAHLADRLEHPGVGHVYLAVTVPVTTTTTHRSTTRPLIPSHHRPEVFRLPRQRRGFAGRTPAAADALDGRGRRPWGGSACRVPEQRLRLGRHVGGCCSGRPVLARPFRPAFQERPAPRPELPRFGLIRTTVPPPGMPPSGGGCRASFRCSDGAPPSPLLVALLTACARRPLGVAVPGDRYAGRRPAARVLRLPGRTRSWWRSTRRPLAGPGVPGDRGAQHRLARGRLARTVAGRGRWSRRLPRHGAGLRPPGPRPPGGADAGAVARGPGAHPRGPTAPPFWPPAEAEDQNGFVVTAAFADENDVTTLSDLGLLSAADLPLRRTAGMPRPAVLPAGARGRRTGWSSPAFRGDAVAGRDRGGPAAVGQVDVGMLETTDARLADSSLVPLGRRPGPAATGERRPPRAHRRPLERWGEPAADGAGRGERAADDRGPRASSTGRWSWRG